MDKELDNPNQLTEGEKITLEVERIKKLIEKDRQREKDREKAIKERKEWEAKQFRTTRHRRDKKE